MSATWPSIPYEAWIATCDTLHAHTQVLGKLAATLAPPEPELQHAALRLTARGWETLPLPAPDGDGAIVVALDLHAHEAVAEHTGGRGARLAPRPEPRVRAGRPGGRVTRIPLRPDRRVGAVTRELLAAIPAEIDPTPQEVSWTVPLDEDDEHATYDAAQVARYFAAATRAALVLAEFRAPYR